MISDSEIEVKVTERRIASFLRRAQAGREFSSAKLAILVAVFIAAVIGVIMLLLH